MPQVHNKSNNDTTFGKDSRYMTSLRFTDITLRRVNVLNALENRLSTKRIDYMKSDSAYRMGRMDRVRQRLEDNLNKRTAYKLVLKANSISDAKDYKKALNRRYSLESFQNDIRDMLKHMKPDAIRERKARLLLQENQFKYDILLSQSRKKFNKLVPEKRTWIPRHVQAKFEAEKKQREEKEKVIKASKPPPLKSIEERQKRDLAKLRRRIITIDDTPTEAVLQDQTLKLPPIKPPLSKTPTLKTPTVKSPRPEEDLRVTVKTPTITKQPSSTSIKRQGITMTMMKKQKSFVHTQERTMSPKEFSKIVNSSEGDNVALDTEFEVATNKDQNNNEVLDSAIPKHDGLDIQIKATAEARSNKFNKKQPTLPPIESHRTPRAPSRDSLTSKTPRVASREDSHRVTRIPSRDSFRTPRVPSRDSYRTARAPSRDSHKTPRDHSFLTNATRNTDTKPTKLPALKMTHNE